VNRHQLEQILADFEQLHDPHAEPALEAVKAAIMLEEVFGIRLSDNEIDPALLAHTPAMKDLVTRDRSAS
jgi:hypothetical protein